MKIILLSFFTLLFQIFPVNAQQKRLPQIKKLEGVTKLTARQIATKVLPSVVLIITQDEDGNPISQGSGFVIRPGVVVSNLHVFERASKAKVKNVSTGEISDAIEVLGMNAKEDICVIKIDNIKFPPINFGDTSKSRIGDEIYVASNPKGLEGSFTKGIISSLRSDLGLFQIDAAISPGSSGGVLLNEKAQAIGIIKSSIIGGQNLNFAIPINKLEVLPLKFKHSIQLAGACAFKDRDKERLKGLVKTVVEKSRNNRIENGRLIETEPVINAIHVYDLEGNEIEYSVYDVNGNFAVKFIYMYDENRMKTSIRQEFRDGKIKEIPFTIEDSIYNKLYNRKFSGSIGSLDKQTGLQVFDSNGNMSIWFLSGTKQIFEYDAEGRVKEKTQIRNGKIEIKTRFRYKDDKYGNWIEKYEYNNFPTSASPEISPDEWVEGETAYDGVNNFV